VLSLFRSAPVVRLSLNEVEVTTRKAALGAGFPLGLAEEAGASAAWLAAAGLPFEKLLAAALLTTLCEEPQVIRRDRVYTMAGNTSACSAIRVVPSACDLVIASAAARDQVTVEAVVDVPALAIAQAVLASSASSVPLALEIGSMLSAVTIKNPPVLFGTVAELARFRSELIRIRLAQQGDGSPKHAMDPVVLKHARASALEEGVWAEDLYWERIRSLAARTLVPATAQSREHGAGAGLIDSD
jgi:hypothetical protein